MSVTPTEEAGPFRKRTTQRILDICKLRGPVRGEPLSAMAQPARAFPAASHCFNLSKSLTSSLRGLSPRRPHARSCDLV